MSPATWQFAAAFTLIAAWVAIVGRPVLANWNRRRQADRNDEGELSDGPASALAEAWYARPRPVASWRDQPLTTRRLQMMMAYGFACLFSLLLAIALGGEFVRLLVVMLVITALYLVMAVVIGSMELKRADAHREAVAERAARRSRPSDVRLDRIKADDLGLAAHLDELEGARRADQPLIFEPLNFEEIFADLAIGSAFDDLIDDLDDEPAITGDAADDGAVAVGVEFEPSGLEADSSEPDEPEAVEAEPEDDGPADGPTFSAAPEVGAKQASARARQAKRRRARPIYIESVLDEADYRADGTDRR